MFENYPDIVNITQVMKMLQIGKSSAYYLLRSGKIASKKVRRKYIISKFSIIDFVNETQYNTHQSNNNTLRPVLKGDNHL